MQRNPHFHKTNWGATIKAHLRYYQMAHKTVIAKRLVGFGRRGQALTATALCVD